MSSSLKSAQDQNTVILRAFSKKVGNETDRIYQIIMQNLSDSKKEKSTNSNSSSKMDELKKLGELKASGILTEEEFQIEKDKILKGQ